MDDYKPEEIDIDISKSTQNEDGKPAPKTSVRVKIDTEDIIAIGALIVAVIIAIGIVVQVVDVTKGGTIIGALVGTAGISRIIKARRYRPRKTRNK